VHRREHLPGGRPVTIAALQALIDAEIPGIRRLPAPRFTRKGGPSVDTTTAYRTGDTAPIAVEAVGLTQDQLAANDTAPGPTAAGLIAWGMQHPGARMQRLAEQARTALADLQQAQRREAVVTAAEDRVREVKDLLAAAEQALRTAKGTTASDRASAPAPRADRRAESTRIRAWARAHGYQVGTAGLISREITDAYHAAHSSAA
jgi:hypothetical protein